MDRLRWVFPGAPRLLCSASLRHQRARPIPRQDAEQQLGADKHLEPALAIRTCIQRGLPFKLLVVPVLNLFPHNPVSQSGDPIFKPLHFHRHHIGVVSAVRHCSHTLKRAEEMHSKRA